MCICVIYPIIESSGALKQIGQGLFSDSGIVSGKKEDREVRELGGVNV